jgi:hypothetical protein
MKEAMCEPRCHCSLKSDMYDSNDDDDDDNAFLLKHASAAVGKQSKVTREGDKTRAQTQTRRKQQLTNS